MKPKSRYDRELFFLYLDKEMPFLEQLRMCVIHGAVVGATLAVVTLVGAAVWLTAK
jgi:hypothetical protein